MRLAFYIGGGTWFDKVTRWRTGGNCSHVELLFSDDMAFSSSQWDGGVRFKQVEGLRNIDAGMSEDGKWRIVAIKGVSEHAEACAREWCKGEVGKKYDWRGILKIFALGRDVNDVNSQWFCSEICHAALLKAGMFWWLECGCTPAQLMIAAMGNISGYCCGYADGFAKRMNEEAKK